jgi:hypothetical protein
LLEASLAAFKQSQGLICAAIILFSLEDTDLFLKNKIDTHKKCPLNV